MPVPSACNLDMTKLTQPRSFMLVVACMVILTHASLAQAQEANSPAAPSVPDGEPSPATDPAPVAADPEASATAEPDTKAEPSADEKTVTAAPQDTPTPADKPDVSSDSTTKPDAENLESKKDAAKEGDAKEDDARKKDDAEQMGEAKVADGETKPESVTVPVVQPTEPARLPNFGSTSTEMIPGQPWRVHDSRRPKPVRVTPGELSTYDKPGTAPSDAIVLFDGEDLSNWAQIGSEGPEDLRVPQWKVEDGYFEVVPRTGTMRTIDSFGSCQLHIEWQSPAKVRGDSQNRGNSGIKIMQVFEVQVLDSFNNRTYADGYAGSMYGQYPPMVNATREPGQWQVYDIIFEAPKYKDDGSLAEPAYLTLIHNGVLLHHRRAYSGPTGRSLVKYRGDVPAEPIALQDHGSPVRYRNIWIRPLDL